MRRTVAFLVSLAMAAAMALAMALLPACGLLAGDQPLIGIALPNQSSARWTKDGDTMKDILVERGYRVDLRYAGDDVQTQIRQLEVMLENGAKVLVVTAVDGASLSAVLDKAAEGQVPVVAYDRLVLDTEAVSYCATFDNAGIGQLQAASLLNGIWDTKDAGPHNIELFAGSPDDANASYVFDSAMSYLQNFIDAGLIRVPSGQATREQAATQSWNRDAAQARMEALLAAYYSDGRTLHGVLSPNDGISQGIIAALDSFGYSAGTDGWPIITGQDADPVSVKLITTGEQYSTVLKDSRLLAMVAADMVEALLEDRLPVVNDVSTYYNNVIVVPTYCVVPYTVHAGNYRQLLIDSGYLSESEIR